MLIERVEQNLRFQGQYHDAETGLHYNRFRHYDPAAGIYLNQDPLGLLGGTNIYAYPTDPLSGIDPFGLVEPGYTGAGGQGYSVYGLGEFDDKGNLIRTVYVGQTETARFDTRMQEHMNTGRYHGGLQAYVITRTDTYGQARGAEQYHIEHANGGEGTRDTSQRGHWYDKAEGKKHGPGLEADRSDSFDRSRTDARANAYNQGYESERNRVATTTRTCS